MELTTPVFENTVFEIAIIVVIGLIFGSFASALVYRVPRKLPWITKGKSEHGLRSACPSCKSLLKPRDLIPIFSWLLSKGQCRHCKQPISKVYPICELLTILGCLGIYAVYGLTWFSIPFFLMIPFLVALFLIDFERLILPNQLVAIVFGLGAVTALLRYLDAGQDVTNLTPYFLGAIVFAVTSWLLGFIMEKVLKKEALGFGDVKFFAAAGMWLGIPALGHFCIGAGVLGVVLGMVWKKITGKAEFPFGPALILSFYAVLLLQGSHLL